MQSISTASYALIRSLLLHLATTDAAAVLALYCSVLKKHLDASTVTVDRLSIPQSGRENVKRFALWDHRLQRQKGPDGSNIGSTVSTSMSGMFSVAQFVFK